MSCKSVHEEHSEGSRTRLCRVLRLPAWVMWRLLVGGLATLGLVIVLILGIYAAVTPGGPGTITSPNLTGLMIALCVWVGLALVTISVPLLLVVWGFVRQKRWAAKLALAQDVMVLLASVWMLALSLRELTGMGVGGDVLRNWAGAVGICALLLTVEARHLLEAAWIRRAAWPALGIVAIGLLWLGLAMPPLAHQRFIRHVRPLLGYIQAHWFAIPANSRISVELTGRPRPTFVSHRDYITVETGKVVWEVQADHQALSRWRVPVDPQSSFPDDLMVFRGQPADRSGIDSESAARELLRNVGVTDRDLIPVPSESAMAPFGSQSPPLVPRSYAFESPRGQGRYRISGDGWISFLAEHSLEVP